MKKLVIGDIFRVDMGNLWFVIIDYIPRSSDKSAVHIVELVEFVPTHRGAISLGGMGGRILHLLPIPLTEFKYFEPLPWDAQGYATTSDLEFLEYLEEPYPGIEVPK